MVTKEVSDALLSIACVVEDVFLQQCETRLRDIDLASRKAEEASLRRYKAAEWLRKNVGVVGGKDLPAQPSEEQFRLGLRSGIILCNVLNKIQPGSVAKVVEGPSDSVIIPDGAALSASQYFDNVRKFLVAAEEMGFPCFEASDLEQGGKSATVVNCVLALKSYADWKQSGTTGTWKNGANPKPPTCSCGKPFVRQNSEPFMNLLSCTSSMSSASGDKLYSQDINEAVSSCSLSTLVRAILLNQKPEDIPNVIESMLHRVAGEFKRRLGSQNEMVRSTTTNMAMPDGQNTPAGTSSDHTQVKEESAEILGEAPEEIEAQDTCQASTEVMGESPVEIEAQETYEAYSSSGEQKCQILKKQLLVEQQQREIQELKCALHNMKEGMQFLQTKYQEDFNILGNHLRGLAHAASGYQRVLDENGKLYNQVQDLKGNVRVYCRVRPFLSGQPRLTSSVDHVEEGNITIITPSKYGKDGRKSFSFNKVFGPLATQEEVFSDTQPLIRSVLDGYNVCIFAYGQTGSGKTYTMSGPKELTEEGLGVNYRALSDLFLLSDQRKDIICYEIAVQMLEIYNEQVRDLLANEGVNKRLEIRNSSANGINVLDANLVPVSSTSDVMNIMNLGQKNRAVSTTAMNDRSSRSHSCLTVHVQGRNLTSGSVLHGSMHLVDLAGSERVDKSEVTGDRLKEARHINKSLAALGDVIASLAQKNSHVPYRNSKLTQLLQDSLGGQAKTLMFVHISPEPEAIGETIRTLKFAGRVATVELGAARVNKDIPEVKELKEQISSLKAPLARKDGELENSQYSRSSTPEKLTTKSTATSASPSQCSWHGAGDTPNAPRKFIDDIGYDQVQNNSIPGRRSMDPRDLIMSSSHWPPLCHPAQNGKENEKKFATNVWVDKIMGNKHDIVSKADTLLGQWEVETGQLPDIFLQSFAQDPSELYLEQTFNKSPTSKKDTQECDSQSNRYEIGSTDGSEELEAGTSDCSEPDLQWQSNIARMGSLPNITGSSKARKSSNNTRGSRSTEAKSIIPSPTPSATRKLPNGIIQAKPRRKIAHADEKRKVAHPK